RDRAAGKEGGPNSGARGLDRWDPDAVAHPLFPPPLVGGGGGAAKPPSRVRGTGAFESSYPSPGSLLVSIATSHPLPQGERVAACAARMSDHSRCAALRLGA